MTWQEAMLMMGVAALISALVLVVVLVWGAHEAEVNDRA